MTKTDKQLKSKAINFKGKGYVQVKDRITYFNDNYPNGCIQSKILSDDGTKVVVMAKVIPDISNPDRYFTGISASNPAKQIEKMSPYEVAETSAVGRAMAMLGIGVIDSIASADEMVKAGVSNTPSSAPDDKDSQLCETHNIMVPMGIKKADGKPYWRCWKDGGHFLQDPNQDEPMGYSSGPDGEPRGTQEKLIY